MSVSIRALALFAFYVASSASPRADEPLVLKGTISKPAFSVGSMWSLQFTPNGETLVTSASHDRAVEGLVPPPVVRTWSAKSGKSDGQLKGYRDPVVAFALAPNGKSLFTAHGDENVRVADFPSGLPRATFKGTSRVSILAVDPTGARLACGSLSGETVSVWDVKTEKQLATFDQNRGGARCLALSQDGSQLAIGCGDGCVRLWDVKAVKLLAALEGHKLPVGAVTFGRDGRAIFSASGDNTVRRWDLATKKAEVVAFDERVRPTALRFSADCTRLATGDVKGQVVVWDTVSGKRLADIGTHDTGVWQVAFSPDGKALASAGDDSIKIWKLPAPADK